MEGEYTPLQTIGKCCFGNNRGLKHVRLFMRVVRANTSHQ